jgi:hypothetical protein
MHFRRTNQCPVRPVTERVCQLGARPDRVLGGLFCRGCSQPPARRALVSLAGNAIRLAQDSPMVITGRTQRPSSLLRRGTPYFAQPCVNDRKWSAMRTIGTALLVLVALGALAPANAQKAPSFQPPPAAASPPPPPPLLSDPWGRGPPLPPDRPYLAPRSEVAPPMQRTPQVAPLSPRIGN